MKESMWGYAIIVLGILAVGIIWFFANTTRTDQHNYNLLKETTEAALIDSLDLAAYRLDGTIRIEEEKFVENFIRRFAENADLSNTYVIEIFDVNTEPPKVSLRVSSKKNTTATGEIVEFDMVNNLDAILETKYYAEEVNDESSAQNQYKNCVTKSQKFYVKPTCTCNTSMKSCDCTMTAKLRLPTNSTVKNIDLKITNSYYARYVSTSDVRLITKNKIGFTLTSRIYSFMRYAIQTTNYTVNYRYCY